MKGTLGMTVTIGWRRQPAGDTAGARALYVVKDVDAFPVGCWVLLSPVDTLASAFWCSLGDIEAIYVEPDKVARCREAFAGSTTAVLSLKEAVEALQKRMVEEALDRNGGKISPAALELGISRPTFYELMDRHRLYGRRDDELR